MIVNLKTKVLLILIIITNLWIIREQYVDPNMYIVISSYITLSIAFALFVAMSGNRKNFITNRLAKIFTSLEFY